MDDFDFLGFHRRASSKRTSRFIGPLLKWLIPNLSDETISAIQGVIRKGGHMTEYGILWLFLWSALVHPKLNRGNVWSWQKAGWAWGLALVYAISDEWHQSFVASREGAARDVGFDMIGASVALLLLWGVGRRFKWWVPQLNSH